MIRPRPSPRPWHLTLLLMLIAAHGILARADLLDDIRYRGEIRCGVHADMAGFSKANSLNEYSGFDVDICRAVATALFNNRDAAKMIPLTEATLFAALRATSVDLLVSAAAWTAGENTRSADFAGISFYDGQVFMSRKSSQLHAILELDKRPVCVVRHSTANRQAAEYFASVGIEYRPVFASDNPAAWAAYIDGQCIALTANRSVLAAFRAELKKPKHHRFLSGAISKLPLGLAVPHDQHRWSNVVRWTLNCLINAEELGITSRNILDAQNRSRAAVRHLLGLQGSVGPDLGLDLTWCKRVLSKTGNYGELYARHLGPDTRLGLPRGLNALWTDGGLLFAPPVR